MPVLAFGLLSVEGTVWSSGHTLLLAHRVLTSTCGAHGLKDPTKPDIDPCIGSGRWLQCEVRQLIPLSPESEFLPRK